MLQSNRDYGSFVEVKVLKQGSEWAMKIGTPQVLIDFVWPLD